MAANAIASQMNNSTALANVASVIESYGAATNLVKGKTKKKRGHATTNSDARSVQRDLTNKSNRDRHDSAN